MRKLASIGTAFNKALNQICTILSAICITWFILTYYGFMNHWYTLLILAGAPAVISSITLWAINRWESEKGIKRNAFKNFFTKLLKIAYAIPLTGIALLFLILLEPSMPYRWLGFIVFIILVGIPADMFINRPSTKFFGPLSHWDVLTDVALSCLAGYIVASNWNNPLIVVPTLFIAYVIIVLCNISINPKGINKNAG